MSDPTPQPKPTTLRVKLFERDYSKPMDKHAGTGVNPKDLGWLPPLRWVEGVDQRRAAATAAVQKYAPGRTVAVSVAVDGQGEYISAMLSKNKT